MTGTEAYALPTMPIPKKLHVIRVGDKVKRPDAPECEIEFLALPAATGVIPPMMRYGNGIITSRFYDSPREPMAGLQLVEGALAAINGGIYGLAYWTFSDEPEEPNAKSAVAGASCGG